MRTIHLTMLLLSCGLLAGCGGDERLEYQSGLRSAAIVLEQSLAELPVADSGDVGPREVEQLARELRRSADQLEQLDPPEEVEPAQRRLERGMRGIARAYDKLADDLREARTDAEQGEVYVTFATDEKIDDIFDDIVAAQQAYAEAGFRVFDADPASERPA